MQLNKAFIPFDFIFLITLGLIVFQNCQKEPPPQYLPTVNSSISSKPEGCIIEFNPALIDPDSNTLLNLKWSTSNVKSATLSCDNYLGVAGQVQFSGEQQISTPSASTTCSLKVVGLSDTEYTCVSSLLVNSNKKDCSINLKTNSINGQYISAVAGTTIKVTWVLSNMTSAKIKCGDVINQTTSSSDSLSETFSETTSCEIYDVNGSQAICSGGVNINPKSQQ